MDPKFYKPETLSLHGGQLPDPVTGARAVPIYQTTSYVFENSDQAAAQYNLEQGGISTRGLPILRWRFWKKDFRS